MMGNRVDIKAGSFDKHLAAIAKERTLLLKQWGDLFIGVIVNDLRQ